MKSSKSKTGKYVYDIPDDVSRRMLLHAKEALINCYPKPNEGYAAAVLTEKGTIYTGASYNSKTETLTMHGEAVALSHAANHGETDIVAITGPNCHICKQLIYESGLISGIDIVVVMEEDGEIVRIPISEMMPYPWPEA